MESVKNTKKIGVIARVLFIVSIIALVITMIFSNKKESSEINATTEVVPVREYTIEYDPEMYNVNISSEIVIDNLSYTGQANIMNIQNYNESMKVDITLEETEELIYQSGYINSEEMIENITITKELEIGTYPATATFNVYNKETKELLTQVVLMINIKIVKGI